MTDFSVHSPLILRIRKYFPILAAVVGGVIVVLVHDAFGTAWDDSLQAQHGENCLDFYLSGGKDRSFLEFKNMHLYGSFFEVASAALHRVLHEDDIFKYRGLLCGLVALVASGLIIRLVSRSEGRVIGWFAGLFLLSSTQFWGQAFINSKDIPFTAVYVFWWYCYMEWFKRGFLRDRWLAGSSLALGLVLATRIGGIPLLGFTVCAGFFGWILKQREENASWIQILGSFPFVHHCIVFLVGWGVMILLWPTATLRPFYNPMEAFITFLAFPWKIYVFFLGSVRFSDTLPRYAFLLEHFLAQPLWCYPLYVAGCFALIRMWRTGDSLQRFYCLCIGFWILPLFLIFAIKPFSFYNGVRQSLFLWPAYAWLAALGLQQVYLWLGGIRKKQAWAVAAGATVLLCNVFLLMAQHPFNYTYRNPVVRLLPGGVNGFDSDYHALSYRLAAKYFDSITVKRVIARELPPTVLIVASEYGAPCYSRFVKFPSRSLFKYEIINDAHLLQFEYIVILRNLTKKPWMFHDLKLEECEIEDQIQTNGQIHTTIYRRVPRPSPG